MNKDWHNFISERHGSIAAKLDVSFPRADCNQTGLIFPLAHFGAVCVSGRDASKLLQGQVTCNVNDISPDQSRLTAMCNPKGRVITTFLLVSHGDSFLLVMPIELIEAVQKKLQMYVLRSDVRIQNVSDLYAFTGISEPSYATKPFETEILDGLIAVTLPGKPVRKLLLAPAVELIAYWQQCLELRNLHESDSAQWRLLDLMAGIPWLTLATSEEFIPQMLNLDKMGGISFTKGCYTGQEIVARTHYLGKNKREMVLAECVLTDEPKPNSAVIISNQVEQQAAGHVLMALSDTDHCKLLLILQTLEHEPATISLRDYPEANLRLIPFAV